MKQIAFSILIITTIWACTGDAGSNAVNQQGSEVPQQPASPDQIPPMEDVSIPVEKKGPSPIPGTGVTQEQLDNLSPNPNIPEGDFAIKKVNFAPELSVFMAQKGNKTFDQKCKSCHTIKGSGGKAIAFEGMFDRHDPAWVLNMIRNVPLDDLSPKAKGCITRTPEGKLEFIQGRDVLEFIRSIDEK